MYCAAADVKFVGLAVVVSAIALRLSAMQAACEAQSRLPMLMPHTSPYAASAAAVHVAALEYLAGRWRKQRNCETATTKGRTSEI